MRIIQIVSERWSYLVKSEILIWRARALIWRVMFLFGGQNTYSESHSYSESKDGIQKVEMVFRELNRYYAKSDVRVMELDMSV